MTKPEDKSIHKKIIQRILKEVPGEYTEMVADELVNRAEAYLPLLEAVGDDIPLVKTGLAVIRAPRNISDLMLGVKVSQLLFNSNLSKVDYERIKKDIGEKDNEQLWRTVMFSVNSHDNEARSAIVGRLIRALADKYITHDEFNILLHAANSMNVPDMNLLVNKYTMDIDDYNLGSSKSIMMATYGLMSVDDSMIGTWGGGGPTYTVSTLGWKFAGIISEFKKSDITGIAIGTGPLLQTYTNKGAPTGNGVPLELAELKNKTLGEIIVFLRNVKGEIAINNSTKAPLIVGRDYKRIDEDSVFRAVEITQATSYKDSRPMLVRTYLSEKFGAYREAFEIEIEPGTQTDIGFRNIDVVIADLMRWAISLDRDFYIAVLSAMREMDQQKQSLL